VDAAESARILEAIRQHVLRPEFIYRHQWRVGDVVMWDNCSCLHKATADFDLPLRRRMHRTTLASTSAPVSARAQ
jgi:taurine dioxygenase